MLLIDLYQETMGAISSNKARSSLTILGIVIGVSSVIAMIAIGQGSQKSIESNIQSIGANLLQVMPGAQRSGGVSSGFGSAQTLTLADSQAIQSDISNVKAVAPETSKRYQVTTKGKNTNTSIVGTVATYPQVRNLEIDSGSFFSDQDNSNLSKVAVLGPDVVSELFATGTDPVGQTVKINNISFRIVGTTKSKGGSGFGSQDDMVFVPIGTAQRYLSGDSYVSTISVQADSQEVMTTIQTDITSLLLERHKISDSASADFRIMNQADVVSTMSSVTGTLTLLLGAIAGISLVVGGIGIMNMMLTTVTERTREIGLRKAIGAKRNDISNQFLAESVMLTFIGGFLGVVLGWLIAWGVTKFASITTSVSMTSVLMAFGVSAAIGIVFGYYPARRAAKLNPIEALRYE